MPEILTESFCERCGTRYTFQAATPARSRFSRLKVIARGLRNYVLSDDTTLEEAFADARSDEEREISAQQLEAFHRTFNFCLSCRQYTCGNCWNEAEGRCLTCAPDLSREPLPAPFPTLSTSVEPLRQPPSLEEGEPATAWPARDLPSAAPSPAVETDGPGLHPPTSAPASAPTRAQPTEALPAAGPAAAETERAAGPAETERAAETAERAIERTGDLLARFRPGAGRPPEPAPTAGSAARAPGSVEEPTELGEPTEVDEPPAVAAAAEREAAGRPALADEPPAPGSELPAAELPAPPTPAAATRRTEPGVPTDTAEQPVWPAPSEPPPAPTWPPIHLATRTPGHARAAEAVWAESSRDVLGPRSGGVQACVACGLPLSATARFCRRCGSPQQRG